MSDQNYTLIPQSKQVVTSDSVTQLLNSIRPLWKGRKLIQRVSLLIPVDLSSACQRLFNASIHDLKEKIIVMGVDLAKVIAANYKLPSINDEDDILNYNVSKTIDLSYRIGLLSRPEWRRIHRCYEIRRDLEHEDNEYEAVLEDCFYIFKTTIDTVLSKDPIQLLKITDIKEIVENPTRIQLSEEFTDDYKNAPVLRQIEILRYLVSIALNNTQPDVVRENCVEMMRHIKDHTNTKAVIDTAKQLEEKLGRRAIDLATAKIGHAIGATGYFKKAKINDYYSMLLKDIKKAGTSSNSWNEQKQIMIKLEDIGGLEYCPEPLYYAFLKELVLIYIGEQSYGPFQNSRKVFYSDGAAPIVLRIFKIEGNKIAPHMDKMRKSSKRIVGKIEYIPILRRFEELMDVTSYDEEI